MSNDAKSAAELVRIWQKNESWSCYSKKRTHAQNAMLTMAEEIESIAGMKEKLRIAEDDVYALSSTLEDVRQAVADEDLQP